MRSSGAISIAGASAREAFAPTPEGPPGRHGLSRRVAVDLVGFFDVAGVLIGGLLPAAIYGGLGRVGVHWPSTTQTCLLVALFVYLCLRHFGLYDTSRIHDLPWNPGRVALAILIGIATVFGLGQPFGLMSGEFWLWYGIWATASLLIVLGGRLIARRILIRLAREGQFDARVAVYGAGTAADRLLAHLDDPSLSVRIAGVYDDRAGKRDAAWRRTENGTRVDGTLSDLIRLGRSGGVDQIVIALPQSSEQRIADVARQLEQLPVSVHVCTHFMGDLVDHGNEAPHAVSRLGPVGLLDIKAKPLADWGRHLKAAEDLIVASITLVLAAPLMALIAIAVKLDSPGPVLFRQRRHGLNRRVIEVLKFRTMRVMEDGAEVRQACAGDPRVTRLGRFLRSSSLDELPQLFNVLKGEMSLIGPRPHALVHDDQYGEIIERYANRHQVKPGMTGWAQVNGFRGPTETPEKMLARLGADLHYIDNWSLWLDLKILAMTLFVGLRHKNAL
jgi:putative colanic acid biosynthesis UDP-glucose lipid carrier transferase